MEQNRCPGCMEIKTGPVCEHCGWDAHKQNEPHQLQTGTVLQDKYLVGRALGQGGFGITYLGWNRYLEKKVAIKEYYPSFFVERHTGFSTKVTCKSERMEEAFAENRLRFLREAKLLAKLEAVPQIVSILDFFEANNTAYIVMEYLQGNDLKAYIKKRGGRLTPTQTLNIMRPVMAALVKVHEAGLVHRDISPDNIMLQFDGSVKLMDFGAARSVNNPGVEKELTQATQAIVKHGFAPVEQYSERGSIGPWTDEYALCATMYYCMTGKVPENVHDRIIEGSDLNWAGISGLTEQQKKILCKGTAIHAKDRHANIRELMDALFPQQVKKAEEPSQRKPSVKEKKKKPKAGKRIAVLLMGAILLVVLVFAVLPKGWVEHNGEYYYYRMGTKVTGWQEIAGSKYHFAGDGKMETGWQEIDGNQYLLDTDGRLMIILEENNNKQYYFDQNGMPLSGWQEIGGDKYYFDRDGKMLVKSRLVNSSRRYFDQDRKVLTGWHEIDKGRYYFSYNGEMIIKTKMVNHVQHYYDQNDKPLRGWKDINNEKYYFNRDGRMMTGLQEIGNSKYCFSSSGKMVTGWYGTFDEYYFDSDGKMVTGWRTINGVLYGFSQDGKRVCHIKEHYGNKYGYSIYGGKVTGWHEIGGVRYNFGSDGRLIE